MQFPDKWKRHNEDHNIGQNIREGNESEKRLLVNARAVDILIPGVLNRRALEYRREEHTNASAEDNEADSVG